MQDPCLRCNTWHASTKDVSNTNHFPIKANTLLTMIQTSTTCRALAPRTPRLEAPSTAKVTTLFAHQSRSGIQDIRTHSSCVASSCASPQATSTTPRNTSHMLPGPVPGRISRMAYSLMRCLCLGEPSSNTAMNVARNRACVTSGPGPCYTPSTRHPHGPAPHQALHHKKIVKIAPSHRSLAAPSTVQIQIHPAGFRSTHRLSHSGRHVQELHQRGKP